MAESTIEGSGRRRDVAAAATLAAGCLAVFLLSPVDQVGDSHFTLLLADQLMSHRSFDLAPPLARGLDPSLPLKDGLPDQLEAVDEHFYVTFSPAGSVLAMPILPVLKASGWHLTGRDGVYDPAAEARGQSLLAAALMAAAAAVFFAIARTLLPRPASLLVGLAGALGTPVWSTASRALWSHTWGLLFASLGVLVLLRGQASAGRVPCCWRASWEPRTW
jgi:hypothetical protein